MTLIGIVLVVLLSGLLILFLWEERRDTSGRLALGAVTGLWKGAEHRRYARTRTALSVRYEILTSEGVGRWQHVTSRDLSAGGMCLRLYERLTPHTRLKFEIRLPRLTDPICGTGQVRWIQDEERVGPRRTFLTGVQFEQLDAHDLERLLHTIKTEPHKHR